MKNFKDRVKNWYNEYSIPTIGFMINVLSYLLHIYNHLKVILVSCARYLSVLEHICPTNKDILPHIHNAITSTVHFLIFVCVSKCLLQIPSQDSVKIVQCIWFYLCNLFSSGTFPRHFFFHDTDILQNASRFEMAWLFPLHVIWFFFSFSTTFSMKEFEFEGLNRFK